MDAVTAPFVDVEEIRARAPGGGYERGVAYFRDGAVRELVWDAPSGILRADVRGGADDYRCVIRLDPARRDGIVMSATCTCPVPTDCKHIIAALLASNRQAQRAAEAPDAARWRAVFGAAPAPSSRGLALGFELRQRVRRSGSTWSPTRVETATPRVLALGGADVLVGMRPLERGTRADTWIKGTASWEALRRPGHGFEPGQARWFAELHSIARDMRTMGTFSDVSEWITLDDVVSSLFWPHLASAERLGIPFVPTKKQQTVSLAGEAAASVEATRTEGGIVLRPRVVIDGADADSAALRPIGEIGVYRVDLEDGTIATTLAPLTLAEPMAAMLAASSIVVPADDADEFIARHLPGLARRTDVVATGFDVPDAARPALVVTAHFAPRHVLELTLAWRYAGLDDVPLDAAPTVHRDLPAEEEIRRGVERVWHERSTASIAPSSTLHGLDAAEFATHLLPELEGLEGVTVIVTGTRPRYRELTGDPHVSVTTVESADADWFDLGIVVTIDGRMIPFTTLFAALTRGKRKLMLSDGGYFSLAHPSLQRLKDLIAEAGELAEWETEPRLSRYQTALWADFEDVADEAVPAVTWRETAAALRDADSVPPVPVPALLHARLRPYQRAGFEWLAFLWSHGLGGILADDMGLGKTLQMLTLIAHARETTDSGPFLVVAPTSVLSTWRSEAARFTPGLTVAVIDATRGKRRASVAEAAASADIVVTSYTLLRLSAEEFGGVRWAGLILDEAQFVKNAQTKAYRAARDVPADVTFAITGTPLENSLTELWALLSLTSPGLFASARRFRDEYVAPIEQGKVPDDQEGGTYRAARLARLRRRIRPLVLRRTKELVAPDLPAKQEQEVRVELGPAHRALYDAVLQRERQKVLGLLDDLDRNRFIVFRSLTLLRMLSLAPALVDPSHAHVPSSKLVALFAQLEEVMAEGHRALVFSQFTSFLGLVAADLERRGISYAYLDGSTRDRDAAIAAFRGGEAPVFLISLKAGGFGLTLTEADYVFLLDPWWNPAAESQAVDRAHRIGQTRRVMVYRLIADGTIEEKVMALQQRKARLFRSVMDDDALFGQALTADDIRGLFDA